jgi:hypothetical protein
MINFGLRMVLEKNDIVIPDIIDIYNTIAENWFC